MYITRFDRGYSRRKFMQDAARGILATGVLMPVWEAMAQSGSSEKAYPEELLSIEGYTRGKIKTGDYIDANNVEFVKDLLEPVRYEQILKMGRRLKVGKSTHDVMRLSPWEYIEATLKNAGKAGFDAKGNIVNKSDGQPWIGGSPFPDPKTAIELFAAQTLNWGRHDASFYAFKEDEVAPDGSVPFSYTGCWAELSPVARTVLNPKPYWPEHKDKLRYQTVFFLESSDVRGTSFLNVWDYDQNNLPQLYGYLPQYRRVRQYPTDQRFESLVPGSCLYLSDAWAAGDPLYTWGNYKIVGRGPFLAGLSDNWNSASPNWEHKTHGGTHGACFWDCTVELVPEAIIVEAEPLKFPRAPISKKRVWFDARNQVVLGMVTFDRKGLPFRSFDGAYGVYDDGKAVVKDGQHPYWSWMHVTASDIQTGAITRLQQVQVLEMVYRSQANDPKIYETYMTQQALMRLGGASA